MSGADEKMRAVLARLACACGDEVENISTNDEWKLLKVFKRELLPLLLAGQDCRDCLEPGIPLDDKYMAAWDAALAAAQGQQ